MGSWGVGFAAFLGVGVAVITPPKRDIINLSAAKQQVARYYNSGEYVDDLNSVVNSAQKLFARYNPLPINAAVTFDIDDTALSTYLLSKEFNFGYHKKQFHELMNHGALPPIIPVLNLYNYLKNLGIKIIFVTGRNENLYMSTYKNLINAGFKDFELLILRPPETKNMGFAEYKNWVRKELTNRGYTIIGSVGDQEGDISGNDAGNIRVKLPNYIYTLT